MLRICLIAFAIFSIASFSGVAAGNDKNPSTTDVADYTDYILEQWAGGIRVRVSLNGQLLLKGDCDCPMWLLSGEVLLIPSGDSKHVIDDRLFDSATIESCSILYGDESKPLVLVPVMEPADSTQFPMFKRRLFHLPTQYFESWGSQASISFSIVSDTDNASPSVQIAEISGTVHPFGRSEKAMWGYAPGVAIPIDPFRSSCYISYSLAKAGQVVLTIHDPKSGAIIDTLVNAWQDKGDHKARWCAEGLTTGIYWYCVAHNGKEDRKKILLMK